MAHHHVFAPFLSLHSPPFSLPLSLSSDRIRDWDRSTSCVGDVLVQMVRGFRFFFSFSYPHTHPQARSLSLSLSVLSLPLSYLGLSLVVLIALLFFFFFFFFL
jgi:hypothetical protein